MQQFRDDNSWDIPIEYSAWCETLLPTLQVQPGVSTVNPSKVENLGESRIAINLSYIQICSNLSS